MKTPLAWLQLSHQKMRLLVAIIGVAFSNILIFTQLGLLSLLFEGIILVPQYLDGDLFVLSSYSQNLGRSSFPIVYLYQVAAVEGVASASPLYIDEKNWVDPATLQGKKSSANIPAYANYIQILAFNPTQPVFNLPEVDRQLDKLNIPDGVLYDRFGQSQLGKISELFARHGEVVTLMDNQRVRVVGLFNLGSTINDSGHVMMSDWNYARHSKEGQEILKTVTAGIVKLEPEVSSLAVRQYIKKNLARDIQVFTKEELITREQKFIAQFPEGKILNFGAVIGFIVGVVVVYQVLYTDVSEHLPEYATLKAIGYSDRILLIVVLQESLILAIMGFIPGFLSSYWIYDLLTKATRIPLQMQSDVALKVFILTVIMCLISGAIAMNKLRSADPVDVFD
jgi:putative ABC transport system permease protein